MTESVTHTRPWPRDRGSRPALEARFGPDGAALLHDGLTTGDPLADAVVDELHEHGHDARIVLADGIAHGVATLDDPPAAIRALLEHAESRPDYADDDLVDRGSRAYFTAPPAASIISLSAGALVRVYDSPSIAAVLSSTGRLVDGAARRIQETAKWHLTAMVPGSLARGGPGYTSTLQVRLLHAHMRRLVRARDYDEAAFGVPINQIDLVRTWLDFSYTSYRAQALIGFDRTDEELAELYRYWWYLGHLLGIDPRFVDGIASHDDASRIERMVDAVTGPPSDQSAELAEATLQSAAELLAEKANVPLWIGRPALNAIARRIHGDEVADGLRIPANVAATLALTPAVAAIRGRRRRMRADGDAWAGAQAAAIASAREVGASTGPATTYQQQARQTSELA